MFKPKAAYPPGLLKDACSEVIRFGMNPGLGYTGIDFIE